MDDQIHTLKTNRGFTKHDGLFFGLNQAQTKNLSSMVIITCLSQALNQDQLNF
jgi:hypothetical protein